MAKVKKAEKKITENEALIEQMVRDAKKVDEPGEVTKGGIIHKGDDEVPSPMIMSDLTSAGYVPIYNTKTGEPSVINLNMLRRKLRLKRADGLPVFTITRPKVLPKLGSYKCFLHAEDPNRAHYDELGFAVCSKSHLNSPYQVRRHMEKRHKMEWAQIDQERKDREKQEDRAFQRMLMSRGITEDTKEEDVKEKAPLYISDKDRAKAKTK